MSNNIVIFANPCTMQIILLHFDNILLKSNQKSKNAKIIEKLIGIKDYNAKKDRRFELFNKITKDNYNNMRKRIKTLSTDYNEKNSTNINEFLNQLEKYDDKWVDNVYNDS